MRAPTTPARRVIPRVVYLLYSCMFHFMPQVHVEHFRDANVYTCEPLPPFVMSLERCAACCGAHTAQTVVRNGLLLVFGVFAHSRRENLPLNNLQQGRTHSTKKKPRAGGGGVHPCTKTARQCTCPRGLNKLFRLSHLELRSPQATCETSVAVCWSVNR